MKDDADVFHFEAFGQLGAKCTEVVDVDIEHLTSCCIERMVVIINIRVKPDRTTIAVHELNFAHLREFIERLIHRSQRDARHSLARHRKEPVSGGVSGVLMQQRKDQFSLRGEASALLAIFRGNEVGGLHRSHLISGKCLFANHADKVAVVSRHTP